MLERLTGATSALRARAGAGEAQNADAAAPTPMDGGAPVRALTDARASDVGEAAQAEGSRTGDSIAEDLLGTVLWLVSPASALVTGIVVPVDGGFSAFSGV